MSKAALILFLIAASLCSAWEQQVPADIERDYLAADTVLDETPCDWRSAVGAIFQPAVQQCADAREATLYIASHMTQLTGAYYSTERRKANMNALEALAEKKISCTGQSILLVCALRSVGIPARAVFVITWGHIRGNHTWVEAWFDGAWHMIEFNERDFNTPWVMENIGLLNPTLPEQRVYAAAPTAPQIRLRYGRSTIPAEEVTARYIKLSQEWYDKANLPPQHQRLLVDVSPRPREAISIYLETSEGRVLSTAPSPTGRSDLRYFTPLNLPRSAATYYLRLEGSATRHPVHPTSTPAQIVRLPAEAE